MIRLTKLHAIAWRLGLAPAFAALGASAADAQWSTTYEQFYLQAPHNWEFRSRYQSADRLFNAFDYGHAILYETLWTKPNAPASLLEGERYDFLTKKVLVRPPHVPLEEAAVEIRYAQLAPEAKQMFDWAHILHRQIYDVWADESLPLERKDAEVHRLIAYYKTRRDLAFSSKPKSMELMQEQPYSLAFRREYPKFNALIWAYHWLQIGLYEPLIVNSTSETRQTSVRATVARFWEMLTDPVETMPYVMPMTPAVAPEFSKRYPEAAIIFDNLHSMHDVVSDILANDSVPRSRKRAEIVRAARLFRDDTSYVMTEQAWRTMAQHMGLENMGGPPINFLPAFPAKTVTYGAVMTHDPRTGAMSGFKYGSATGGAHAEHGATPPTVRGADSAKAAAPATDPHAGHRMPPPDTARNPGATSGAALQSQNDSAAVAATVERLHAALAAGDSAAALALLLPDVVILESGGAETRDEYRAHHLPADIAFARAVKTERGALRVTVRGDVAWVHGTSTTQGEFRGRQVNSTGAELVVLTRTPEGWRIATLHWSSRSRRPPGS